jgi:hypothetical protein
VYCWRTATNRSILCLTIMSTQLRARFISMSRGLFRSPQMTLHFSSPGLTAWLPRQKKTGTGIRLRKELPFCRCWTRRGRSIAGCRGSPGCSFLELSIEGRGLFRLSQDQRTPRLIWSGRPGSNRRHSAWEADVLPLNYSRPVLQSSKIGLD